MNQQIWLTRVLALLSLAALLFCHLALTDIAHGEPDASQEWLILQISAGILLVFIVVTWLTLGRMNRTLRQNVGAQESERNSA